MPLVSSKDRNVPPEEKQATLTEFQRNKVVHASLIFEEKTAGAEEALVPAQSALPAGGKAGYSAGIPTQQGCPRYARACRRPRG